MAIVVTRDCDRTREQLTGWLARRLPAGSRPVLSALEIPQGAGHSNETLLFEATWSDGGAPRAQRYVARVKPSGRAVFPEYDVRLQFRCMEVLRERTSIPVPNVVWFEEDASVVGQPFYVMERVDGVVPSDNPPFALMGWLAEASPADQARLWRSSLDVLAALHALDWRGIGLGFLDRPQYGPAGFEQQLGYYAEYLPWAKDGASHPLLDDTFAWLRLKKPPDLGPVVLNWGDARISNMMYRDFTPVAVLDWEMACIGPPEVDLGWFWYISYFLTEGLGLSNLPGFPDRDGTAAIYQSITKRPVRHLDYFEVWAGFRFGVVMVAIDAMMRVHGVAMGDASPSGLALGALEATRARCGA
ncbi:MAG: phosphotransferase family protein [Candidatus Binatia bacterium]